MNPIAHEVNFDGIVGPTHSYAGLSYGNVASQRHKGRVSNPRAAALQGLEKMKRLADLGVRQAVLPPHERPDLAALRRLGFSGNDAAVLDQARRQDPALLAACCSASAMWAANAATVSPAADTPDGRTHFTPANLVSQFHRSLEAPTTAAVLRAIFSDESAFAHHTPLPAATALGDEGAANHLRLATAHGEGGVEVFVYGRSGFTPADAGPVRFPARQTIEASSAVARGHGLGDAALFVRQNPAAIDAGAFHNDVVAVANLNVLFHHSAAFADGAVDRVREAMRSRGADLIDVEVTEAQVPLTDAIRSYLFNSQLLSLPDGSMALVAPEECRTTESSRRYLEGLAGTKTPIDAVHFVDVRQSMHNGGGPACLRLRVVLTEREWSLARKGVFLTVPLYENLKAWVGRHYRDRLHPDDLADPKLVEESRAALDELTNMLGLGSVYGFQR